MIQQTNLQSSWKNIENVQPSDQNGPNNLFLSLLKSCQEGHAHSIAQQMNVQLNRIRFETFLDPVSRKTKVMALVEGKNISDNDLQTLAQRVSKECPLAQMNRLFGKEEIIWVKR
ncbi:hypothetical protein RFI_19854 [Reticulomyxa filosa]|uniref:OsmC family protein n=1 Tax=Reticulomyxa filosa TaxID=46433 RepID=X6MU23_RETFI|nr:hypothetical protein RFI_19854 [Reticulomyxa filosa]|eukprot:ETO17468.1 hypothetical protein RFI_19854 [Reticulomyxa filosa]